MDERDAGRHPLRRFDRRELVVLWVAAVVAASIFTLLAVLVWHSYGPSRLDRAGRRLTQSPRVESFLGAHYLGGKGNAVSDAVVWLGSPLSVGLASVILVAAAARWRDRAGVVLAVVAPVLVGVLVEGVFKPIVDRHLHAGGRLLMFPSGHTAGATAVAAVASIVVYRRVNRPGAALFSLVSAAASVAVGFGIVRLGMHFTTDVVGGAAIALSVVLGLAGVLSLLLDPVARPARGLARSTG